MKTIHLTELFNFFGECDVVRNVHGTECSFEIDQDKNQIVISWGRNYETMEHEFTEVFPFDNNKMIEIKDNGLVKLKTSGGSMLYFFFTKTLTPRYFEM